MKHLLLILLLLLPLEDISAPPYSTNVTSATTLTLSPAVRHYVYTGSSSATWTLPTIASWGTEHPILVTNRGSGTLTVQRAASDSLFTTTTATSITFATGVTRDLKSDGTYGIVELPAGGGAPTDATYITQTADSTLSAEQALSSLSTGLMKVTTTTGVISSVTTSAGFFGSISDETGSGPVVGGTNPTISGLTFSSNTAGAYCIVGSGGAGRLMFASGSSPSANGQFNIIPNNQITVPADMAIGWSSSTSDILNNADDVKLYRDAANTLALRNGTSAQDFNIYATYSSAGSNYERLNFHFNGGSFQIQTQSAGTGSSRNLVIACGDSSSLFLGGSTNYWKIPSINLSNAGSFLANADNTYDIGASGASRPRSIYVGTGIAIGSGGTLLSEAADTLSIRNGTTIQQLNVYRTYTDASNYRRVEVAGNAVQFAAAGTGVVSADFFVYNNIVNSTAGLSLGTQGGERWRITGVGHFLAGADNSYDIGATGATRPRTVYVGTSVISPLFTAAGNFATTAGADRQVSVDRTDTTSYGRVLFKTAGTEMYALGTRNDSGFTANSLYLTGLTAHGNPLIYQIDPVSATQYDIDYNVARLKKLRLGPAGALTEATDTITVTRGFHKVEGEGSVSDNLSTISGGAEGDRLVLRAATTGHTITVKDGTGNIQLAGSDFALDNVNDTIELIFDGTNWLEVARANNN